ncbi:MAG: AAA family ATPase [Oligoflexales bacterium]|nr:AAA family ATPase [Oligoflexales bacterium]
MSYQEAIIDQLTILQRQYDGEMFSSGNSVNVHVMGENERVEAQKKFSKIDRIMNLPLNSKRIVKETYQEKINALIAPYSPEIRGKIDVIIGNIVGLSMASGTSKNTCELNSKDDKKGCGHVRPIFYLLGAPGTGKTYLVDEIGKTFNLPVIKIKLNPNTNEFELIGNPTNRYDSSGELGVLTKAFSSLRQDLNFNNPIVFIDEADKIFNKGDGSSDSYSSSSPMSRPLKTFLLDLFDRNHKPLRFNSLGVSLDISKVTFVLAGNAPVIAKTNEFMQRMNSINFGAFSLERRMEIACTQFGRSQQNYNYDSSSIAGLLQTIVAISREDDDMNIGIKSLLKTLDNYILHLKKGEGKTFDLSKNPFEWKKCQKKLRAWEDTLKEKAMSRITLNLLKCS